MKAHIAAEGAEPIAGPPEDYAKDIDSEASKWAAVVQKAGISGK